MPRVDTDCMDDATALSNWRSESMKWHTMTDVMLRVVLAFRTRFGRITDLNDNREDSRVIEHGQKVPKFGEILVERKGSER